MYHARAGVFIIYYRKRMVMFNMSPQITRRTLKNWISSGIWEGGCLKFPLAFSISAQIQGLTMPAFLGNATKMAVNLEDMEKHLRMGAIVAHWDSCLEAQALGCGLDFSSYPLKIDNIPEEIDWPENIQELICRGRFPLTLDVIKRLRARLGERAILVAGVNGPFSLASSFKYNLSADEIADWGMVTLWTAQAFCEAGIDMVIIWEEVMPELNADKFDEYLSVLEPLGNMARFYEAVPVYLPANITDPQSFIKLLKDLPGWLACEPFEFFLKGYGKERSGLPAVALSLEQLGDDKQTILPGNSGTPILITTNREVPFDFNIGELENIVRRISSL